MKIVNFLAMGVMLNVAGVFLSGCPNSPNAHNYACRLKRSHTGENDGLCGPCEQLNPAVPTGQIAQGQWNAQAPVGRRPLCWFSEFGGTRRMAVLNLGRTSIAHWRLQHGLRKQLERLWCRRPR